MLRTLLPWLPLYFGSPSMPAPAPAPVDPSQTPAAIAARAASERQAEVSASQGQSRNMVGGQMMAMQEQMQKGAARAKLGYGNAQNTAS